MLVLLFLMNKKRDDNLKQNINKEVLNAVLTASHGQQTGCCRHDVGPNLE